MQFNEDALFELYSSVYNAVFHFRNITLTEKEEAKLKEGIGIAAVNGSKIEWAGYEDVLEDLVKVVLTDIEQYKEKETEDDGIKQRYNVKLKGEK